MQKVDGTGRENFRQVHCGCYHLSWGSCSILYRCKRTLVQAVRVSDMFNVVVITCPGVFVLYIDTRGSWYRP